MIHHKPEQGYVFKPNIFSVINITDNAMYPGFSNCPKNPDSFYYLYLMNVIGNRF